MPATISQPSSRTKPYVYTPTATTNPEWRKVAPTVIKRLARRHETFTSAEVLDALIKSDVRTPDLRAVGNVMVEARNLGFIESVGLMRRSDKHSRSVSTLWRSLLFQTKAARSRNH